MRMESERYTLEAAYARALLPLARRWRQFADRSMSEMGVSAASGWALVQVGRLGDDVRQSDLAAELDVTAPSLVRIVDQLAEAGFVERRRDPVDARVSRVRLTPGGRSLATRIESSFGSLRQDMLSDVSDDDLVTALRVAAQLEARFAQPWGR
jgi:MarR family transcriptional regulator for hemolysin